MAQTKQPFFGAGIYYIALQAGKNHQIFQSVFEYENLKSLIGNIPNSQLLAFLFSEKTIHLVLQCSDNWSEVVDKLQQIINDMHYKHWHKRQAIVSEQVQVLRVQERYLMPLVLQLHQIPVKNKQVAQASMYPWSSDYLYRQKNPPAWINTHIMLQQLSAANRNQLPYYASAILKPLPQEFDLQQGTDEHYAVIGAANFATRLLAQQARQEERRKQADLQPVYESALKYIAQLHGIDAAHIQDKDDRQFDRLMPLVVWLVCQFHHGKAELSHLVGVEVAQIDFFIRSVPSHHSDALLQKIVTDWVVPDVLTEEKTSNSRQPAKTKASPKAAKKARLKPHKKPNKADDPSHDDVDDTP